MSSIYTDQLFFYLQARRQLLMAELNCIDSSLQQYYPPAPAEKPIYDRLDWKQEILIVLQDAGIALQRGQIYQLLADKFNISRYTVRLRASVELSVQTGKMYRKEKTNGKMHFTPMIRE